jgi:hypothetical protein
MILARVQWDEGDIELHDDATFVYHCNPKQQSAFMNLLAIYRLDGGSPSEGAWGSALLSQWADLVNGQVAYRPLDPDDQDPDGTVY